MQNKGKMLLNIIIYHSNFSEYFWGITLLWEKGEIPVVSSLYVQHCINVSVNSCGADETCRRTDRNAILLELQQYPALCNVDPRVPNWVSD